MENKKYLTYLSLAIKARRCAVGSFACESALKAHRAQVVLCASSASERTREKFRRLCAQEGIPFYCTDDDLARATGKSDIVLFSVTDQNLANAIIRNLDEPLGETGEVHE